MTDNYFDLASALVDEAAGHLIGRDDAKSIATAFGVEIEVFADEDYCSIEARNDRGLVAAATAVLRAGGTLQSSIDVFRAGQQRAVGVHHHRDHGAAGRARVEPVWVVRDHQPDAPVGQLDDRSDRVEREVQQVLGEVAVELPLFGHQ